MAAVNNQNSNESDKDAGYVSSYPGPPTPKHEKLGGYEFYTKVLKSPKTVVAPMVSTVVRSARAHSSFQVDHSELPYRMLCRKYKADLCYSPMLHSRLFATDKKYRKHFFSTCPEDRPLVVQVTKNAHTIHRTLPQLLVAHFLSHFLPMPSSLVVVLW